MSSPVLGTAYINVPGSVGPCVLADGAPANQRMSHDKALVVQDGHARYQEAVYRGNCFFAANQAAVAFSTTATTTTATGLILSNPAGSGKNLVLLQVEIGQTVALAGVASLNAMAFSGTAVTHTTALTVLNALVGSGTPGVGKADQGATLPVAPTVAKILFANLSTTTGVIPYATYDIGGSLVLAPGTAVTIGASAGITASASILWEEIPV